MTVQIITSESEIVLPDSFKCPVCDAAIEITEVSEWMRGDGEAYWKAESVKIDCVTFPGSEQRFREQVAVALRELRADFLKARDLHSAAASDKDYEGEHETGMRLSAAAVSWQDATSRLNATIAKLGLNVDQETGETNYFQLAMTAPRETITLAAARALNISIDDPPDPA